MRILVPLDGSALSEHSIEVAGALARATGAEVMLFTVVETAETSTHAAQIERDHQAQLDRVAERLAGVEVQQRIDTSGEPAAGILNAVCDLEADHIVMTTHGRSGLSRLAQGSVAEEVLRHALVPVTLIRPPDGEQ